MFSLLARHLLYNIQTVNMLGFVECGIMKKQVAFVRHTGTYEILAKEYANLMDTLFMAAEKQNLLVVNEDADRDLHDPYQNWISTNGYVPIE